MNKKIILSSSASIILLSTNALSNDIAASGVDTTADVIFSVDTDNNERSVWGVLVGDKFNYSGGEPSSAVQILVWENEIDLNRNTDILGTLDVSSTLNVSGTSYLDATQIDGNITALDGTVNVNDNLDITGTMYSDGVSNNGTLIQSGTTSINTTGTSATTIGSSSNTSSVSIVSGTSSIVSSNTGNTINGTTSINTTGTSSTSIGNINTSTAVTLTAGNTLLDMDNNSGSFLVDNHGLIIDATNDITTLSGGTNSSTLTLQDASATLSVGTATTSEITVIEATNDGTSTSINIGGNNNLETNITSTTNNILGTTNINTTGTSATTIGSSSNTSSVSIVSGTSSIVSSNTGNTITGTDNTITATDTSTIYGGTSASLVSGTNGFTPYGMTTYSTSQNVGTDYILRAGDSESQTLVTGANVNNIIVGNTLIDGDMYINGTLTYTSNTAATTTVSSSTSNVSGSMDISYTGGATVDSNGALFTSGATAATASLTLTNDLGNTHGIVITESQTTISGGNTSSSLTLADNGATFTDSSTGAPVQVHGVADATSDFDAVNLRQLGSAVAGAAAMANIPGIDPTKNFSLGLGFGNYDGYNAFALGAQARVTDNIGFKLSAAKSGSQRHSVGAGFSLSW